MPNVNVDIVSRKRVTRIHFSPESIARRSTPLPGLTGIIHKLRRHNRAAIRAAGTVRRE